MPDTFHFIRPWWLLLLIPAATLVWLLWRQQDSTRAWRKIMDPHLLKVLMTGHEQVKTIRPITLLAAILTLGILALSGPTWSHEPSPFAEDQAALVILLKVTPSMAEQDVQPSRAERAVQKIQDLLKLRSGARTALIAYSGSAHLVVPLTKDAGIINTFAADLTPAIMPSEGDAAADAIALAEKELTRAKVSGSILLIADTVPNALEQSSTPVQVLGMVGEASIAPLETNAIAIKADFTPVSIDESDIAQISKKIDTSFASMPADQGTHWQDRGYWLLPLIALLTLFWFRPGWKVK